MDFTIHITVHSYTEEQLSDECLEIGSDCYGIMGKEIVAPLREVNGKTLHINGVARNFSVRKLWRWLGKEIYADAPSPSFERRNLFDYATAYGVVEMYLCFDGYRYLIEKPNKPLLYYIRRKECAESNPVEVQFLIHADAGAVLLDDGIRYYFNSKERGKHNEPHVHVDVRHEESGTFSLLTGQQLQKGQKVKEQNAKKVRDMIEKHRQEWLIYWNEHTDGLNVDLNQVLGLIHY